jgi:hypothetical protein
MNEYTNVNRRSRLGKYFGLIACRTAKCEGPTEDNFKCSKNKEIKQLRIKFCTTEYDTDIHSTETVSGSVFIAPSNQRRNSCDTEQ